MAAVYREVEIEWEGKTYTVRPHYKMIQRVEQTISLAALSWRCDNGETPISQLSDLLSAALREAGCKADSADAEAIYLSILSEPEHTERLLVAGRLLLQAMLIPEKKLPGNAKAPASTAGASLPTSTGPSTTGSPLDTSGSSPPNSGG